MPEPLANDESALLSLLIEHPHGTFEVVLRRVEIQNKTGFLSVDVIPVSGSRHVLPTHSCLGNAISMQKWMDEHIQVFAEGLTSYS
ncbi:MAG: hypothetical protein DWI22_13405 [Planctomycetota bacterium]|nr:hypothetical protein [Planctomycetales bacterium]RLT05696.1 MAG: hypothetical protein DWI22_13405 [Planctomycetota bacterium]